MLKVVPLAVPPQFQLLVVSAEPEALAGLRRFVRSELDHGESPSAVIDHMVAQRWNEELAEWYVGECALTDTELDITPYAAYSMEEAGATVDELRRVASAYSLLNWSVLFSVFMVALYETLLIQGSSSGRPIVWILYGCAAGLAIGGGMRARDQIGPGRLSTLVTGVILALIPGGNLIVFLVLGGRMNAFFKKAGVKAGLFGPKSESLEAAIQQRSPR